jgi:hypothetical protein
LVTLLREKEEGQPVTFESVIKRQIKILRKQLDEAAPKAGFSQGPARDFPSPSMDKRDIRPLLDVLSQRLRAAEHRGGPIFPRPDHDIRGSIMDDLQRGGNRHWF